MSPASSFISDAFDGDGEPPTKRRRVSFSESSLSSESSSSSGEEEERPLAATRAERVGKDDKGGRKHNGKHNGKGSGKGKKTGGPGRTRGQRTGGKSMSSMMAPTLKMPPTEQERNDMARPLPGDVNTQEPPVKVEDKMDERQLNRLVTGVTVDAGGGGSTAVSGEYVIFVVIF